jgi:hypothetical protein
MAEQHGIDIIPETTLRSASVAAHQWPGMVNSVGQISKLKPIKFSMSHPI